MNFTLHPEAEAELEEATEFYDSRRAGLGHDFAVEITRSIQRILVFPHSSPVLEDPVRLALVNRFPYGILYMIVTAEIRIIAIIHMRQEPGKWKCRIQ